MSHLCGRLKIGMKYFILSPLKTGSISIFLSPSGLVLLLPIEYMRGNPKLALGLLFKKTSSFCLVFLEDSCHIRTTLLRSSCCGKPKPHGEALADEMSCGNREAREHRDADYESEETSSEGGASHPAAPLDATGIRVKLQSPGLPEFLTHRVVRKTKWFF